MLEKFDLSESDNQAKDMHNREFTKKKSSKYDGEVMSDSDEDWWNCNECLIYFKLNQQLRSIFLRSDSCFKINEFPKFKNYKFQKETIVFAFVIFLIYVF